MDPVYVPAARPVGITTDTHGVHVAEYVPVGRLAVTTVTCPVRFVWSVSTKVALPTVVIIPDL
jgi:hypothetical protein